MKQTMIMFLFPSRAVLTSIVRYYFYGWPISLHKSLQTQVSSISNIGIKTFYVLDSFFSLLVLLVFNHYKI